MSLVTYRNKRDFSRTSEPRGKKARTARDKTRSFVVQKHAARRLHYDFRLECGGVLKSWAVPKGPSMDPADKRLAVETEDHPLAYQDFEGVIPEGEYGAGPVVVWDAGQWVPEGDPERALAKGHLRFKLLGSKLRGAFSLVRTRGGAGQRSHGKQTGWLLIKVKDDVATPQAAQSIVDSEPQSVLSGRSLDEVAAHPEAVWGSGSEASPESASALPSDATRRQATGASDTPNPGKLPGAKRAALPRFVKPQLATLVAAAPAGDTWFHELKLDGYRIQVRIEGGRVSLLTRHGHDWSAKLPTLTPELAKLGIDKAVFDGELVVLDADGVSHFQQLQHALSDGHDADCALYLFDCMHLDGYDLRGCTLRDRKAALAGCLRAHGASERIRLSEHVVGHGPEVFAHACKLGAEGSVCKRADAQYTSGRGKAWLKVKCSARQEFVIGGYSEPHGSRTHLGALLLGVMEGGELKYAGRVGTGFDQASLRELKARLEPLERDTPAFKKPPRGAHARGVHWVEPKLVAEVQFAELTRDGRVRHASFQGLREDKPAAQVHAEHAVTNPAAKGRSSNTHDGEARRADAKSSQAAAGGAPPALRSVRLTHPQRVLFPEIQATKADVALYYARVAHWMLPHLVRRPLMLLRCPEGQGGSCFHQKHPTHGMSQAIKRIEIAESKGRVEGMYVDDAEGLLQLVQHGALEIHSWGSRVDALERPDQLTFDLDPDEGLDWSRMVEAACTIRDRLSVLDLRSFLKVTGGKGLHVVVPIAPTLDWDEIKSTCKAFAESLVHAEPAKYVATLRKSERKGKILIDYLRNGRGATAVCAYSTRARGRAPVATPIGWRELTATLRPDQFTIREVPTRLSDKRDPWQGFFDERPKLTAARRRALTKR